MGLLSESLRCPVCKLALNSVSKSCQLCNNFYPQQLAGSDTFIDLTRQTNISKKPLRTELFRSFWLSFFYEKILPPIWALGLRNNGGIAREIAEVSAYFDSNLNVVVDLSCGTGIMARNWVQSKITRYNTILAIDYSEAMLAVLQQEIVKEQIPADAIATIRADVEALPLVDNSVDAIYSGAAMHCWENPARAVENIYRVLRPGGKVYLTTFVQPLPNIIFRFFSLQEIADIFTNAGFLKEHLMISSRGVYATVKCRK